MRTYTTHEVIKQLIGATTPLGDASRDPQRLENTEELLNVIHFLMMDVRDLARHADSYESSVKQIGVKAQKFLETFKEEYL